MKLEDIDIYNPDNYVDSIPHAQFKHLRDKAPVHWHQHPDGVGYWVLSRHEDVRAVSRDFKTFSAQRGFVMVDDMPEDILPMVQGQLLGMDPPDHGPLRRVVLSRFTSRMLAELEPKVRQICRQILKAGFEKPECNFVYDIAGQLPSAVIGSMLDVPADMWGKLREWSDLQTSGSDPDIGGSPEEVKQAAEEMGAYGYSLAAERKDKGGDDLISLLVNVDVDGHKVNAAEFSSLFIQITVAGNETTRSLIAGGMYELIQRPELYKQLEEQFEARPELLASAIEEMLRWTCPLHYFRRTATKDTEIAGQFIRENDRVVMLYSSANFDDREFEQPLEFKIDRKSNNHMAFGHGIHFCLGAHLARLETKIFFEEFFKMFKGIELTAEPTRIRSNMVNGFKHMPVKLIPR
ncbi:cytochrome P450 [Endozoicomonas sp. OPT23]|uniref:cytochrome P450 n=1 Tax=Endozoicomonas sp. OPT23 TaxID=2072845 RepID=UPI00129ACD76|nr:cytochrome P450 [Endozoicomonas sp. OPT23]MRI34231.1 cytochrome P450 [Endozoicomonas sp. OPT23]